MTGPARAVARPSLGALVGGVFVLAGFVLGASRLRDNSFLTHLATGRLILDSGSVPGSDPYTFTAAGEPWVVQSWLMSVLYATAEELGGSGAIRALVGAITAVLVLVAWSLTRPAPTLFGRVGLTGVVLGIGAGVWSERPLLLGLALLATAVLAVEQRWSPWILIPLGWVWANTHGSFPLGLVALGVLAVGTRLDQRRWDHEPRYLGALALGVLAGVIGPLGPALLVFPVRLLAGSEILSAVAEWRSPAFDGWSERLFLVQVVVAVGLLVRRPTWRAGLLMAVFVVAALVSLRNMAVASIVLLPGMAAAMPSIGTLRASARPAIARTAAVVVALAAVVIVPARLGGQGYRLDGRYPLQTLAWAADEGVGPADVRVATPDFVGNLVDLLWGPTGATFFDDRFDMFPEVVADDYLVLLRGYPGWEAVLDRHEIDAVLWRRSQPLAQLVVSDTAWVVRFVDERWLLATRR